MRGFSRFVLTVLAAVGAAVSGLFFVLAGCMTAVTMGWLVSPAAYSMRLYGAETTPLASAVSFFVAGLVVGFLPACAGLALSAEEHLFEIRREARLTRLGVKGDIGERSGGTGRALAFIVGAVALGGIVGAVVIGAL